MKKQTKIAIGILVAICLVIVGVSILSQPMDKGLSSGTFAKADKYQKTQMTQKDVQLRSELTSDTVKLKGTLQGLTYFAVFTEDLCLKIDTCLNVFQGQGMKSGDAGFSQLILLKDYAVFIRNHNETLGKTIAMLSSFYLSDVTDQSADVEKNLGEFSNYVKLFIEKDSVLESALQGIDSYILGNKIVLERKDELKKLKSIRDQLLIKGIQLGALVQDNSLSANLFIQAMNSLTGIGWEARGVLGLIGEWNAAENLSRAGVGAKVSFDAAAPMNAAMYAQNGLTAGLVYDYKSAGFTAVDALHFSDVMNANQKNAQAVNAAGTALTGVAYTGKDGLKVFPGGFDMQAALKDHPAFANARLQIGLQAWAAGFMNASAAMNASSALNFSRY